MRVTDPATTTAEVDSDSLPDGVVITGDQGTVKVTITNLTQGKAVSFGVRTGSYKESVTTLDRILRSTFSGLGPACCWLSPRSVSR